MGEQFGLRIVHYAHMELGEPTIQQGFDACVADGAEEVIVHPYFLASGHHVAVGIPDLVRRAGGRHPGITYRITQPLGVHQKIGEVILERIAEAIVMSRWAQRSRNARRPARANALMAICTALTVRSVIARGVG